MRVDLHDWVGSHIAVWRTYEPGLSVLIRRSLRGGEHFLDVGANIGYFSLLAAVQVGPGGRVTSIEAAPATQGLLRENIALNGREDQIAVRGLAAWNRRTRLSFTEGPPDHLGIGRIAGQDTSFGSPTTEVDGVPLDEVVPFRDFPVRVIKLDVEGAELKALEGMSTLIDACRPSIALELTDALLRRNGDNASDLLAFLAHRGYEAHRYDHEGYLELFNAERFDPTEQANLWFARRP